MFIPSAEQFVAELRDEFSARSDAEAILDQKIAALDIRVTALEQPPPPAPVTLGQRFGGISEPLARVQGVSTDMLTRWAAQAKDLGVGWLRGDYPVRQVSPSRGTFNYADTDRWVRAALDNGLKPLLIVYMLPQWMNGSTNDKAPPVNNQDFADWCAVACLHWQELGVEWVEIWNEQNLSGFWPSPDRVKYVDLCKRAADAIHANSTVKVLSGGVSTADTLYQAGSRGVTGYTSPEFGCYSSLDCYGFLGLFSHVDGVGMHPYLDGARPCSSTDSNWCNWSAAPIGRAFSILDRWGGQNLSIWNTESAFPRSAGTEQEQALRAKAAFAAFQGCLAPYQARLGPYFWFTLRDWDTASEARARTFGLLYPDWTPHQAYAEAQGTLLLPL